MTHFRIIENNGKAIGPRVGELKTDHGKIFTPIFMPVGTAATVKGVLNRNLVDDVNAEIILGNTYHLYLRPGVDVIKSAGGLHKFMGWTRPILTDSGGYQVFSLSKNRKLTDNGAIFKSHIDGSTHSFTPEGVVDIQRTIGADIMMAFDECTPFPCVKSYAKSSMELTHRWLDRVVEQYKNTDKKYMHKQMLFPIVQGGIYPELRQKSAEYVASKDMPGNAIGGLSVGEPANDMYSMIEVVNEILPSNKPRYLMGVGTPINILEAIERGVDMLDCVMPTRNGRNGMIFTSEGIINIKNKKWMKDFNPIDSLGSSTVSRNYSRAYVRHLIISGEILGAQVCSIHNLVFYMWLVREARERILNGSFTIWKKEMVEKLGRRL